MSVQTAGNDRPKQPSNDAALMKALSRFIEQERKRAKVLQRQYPPNPPNHACNTALIEGFLLSNGRGRFGTDPRKLPVVGEKRRFFQFGYEEVFAWTHTKNRESAFLVRVDESVHKQKVWRTLAVSLRICVAFESLFEHMAETRYAWIYRFNPKLELADQDLMEDLVIRGGQLQSLHDWSEMANVLELLESDEAFYVSAQHLFAAFDSHWFCLHCALAAEQHRRHQHEEPTLWELADVLPRMEMALVQATKAVEGILGKPGKQVNRVRARWTNEIALDPDEQFDLAGLSFIDYYYQLFAERGAAAHSLGAHSLKMSRKIAVRAQTFAYLVLFEYFEKNSISPNEAMNKLKFNRNLLREATKDSLTKMTRADHYE